MSNFKSNKVMKTIKGLQFGFNTVNVGQRNASVEPQVVAVSTEGTFRISPVISRMLNIAAGDHIMFINNIDGINDAVAAKAESVVAYCEANGLEVGSPESLIALHKEFDCWMIAKGIKQYDSKGNVKTTVERLSKNDKIRFATQNFDAMLEAAMEQGDEETKDALSRDGITKEEQIEILANFVTPRELPKYKGSKTANPAGLTGIGTTLNFSDVNAWKQLKADMKDDATKLNRVFSVDVENVQTMLVDNGYEQISVKALILSDYTDKEPARIGSREEDAE